MKNKEEKNTFKRGLAIFLAVLLGFFAVYNAVWFAYREIRYSPFTEKVLKTYGVYITSKDGISYSVAKPSYLRFKGNLALTDEKTMEGILIWPKFPSGYEYAAVIETHTVKENGREIPVLSYITMDEDGNWKDDSIFFGKREKDKFSEKQEDIKEWLSLANEMWNLE